MVEEIIDPKEVQKAPEDWRLIGAEVSEQLDYEPGRFLRRRLVRRKYVRRGDPEAVPLIAALPPSLQERCIAAPDFWRRSSSASSAITFRSTGRKPFLETATGFISRGRPWPVGWDWPRIGCDPSTSRSAPESWPEDTFK